MGRRLNCAGEGKYGVPGGYLEFGESLIAAAKRELKEETGLVADEMKFISIINQPHTETGHHYIQFVFLCDKFNGEPKNIEPHKCAGWEWFDLHNLPVDIFSAHKDFVKTYLEKIPLLEIPR